MSASSTVLLSAADVLCRLELQETFEDGQLENLDAESDGEDKAKGDFCSSDEQEMLIEYDVLTDKGYMSLSQMGMPAERDSLLLMDKKVGNTASSDQG